ncbi:ATP-binding protein [Parabacteroides sp. PF5-6]|uniref:ATP-binding protein n=1 Tax=Parabacteroides sp. PF5-6 TaxID=1742403 RepID=UPI00240741C4|nr:ATP-binding protein [Parabacteroides sp. PF5-6]MDF9828704.1 serine/threonine-protein kinase RsbW [Parabacteroides sp. PF5-6]
MGKPKEIRLKNELSQLRRLSAFVSEKSTDFNLDQKLCLRLNLALEEAVTNVIMYAYPEGMEPKRITVRMEKMDDKLVITLIDAGMAFDPTAKEQPDLAQPANDRPIGGLGIHLIREIMTEVSYCRRRDRNRLTLIKDLH